MNNAVKTSQRTTPFILGFISALMLTGLALFIGNIGLSRESSTESINAENEPLYWVAPMDDRYRRDQPGLSPMGMDLIPVYKKTHAEKNSAGIVKISPEVENNLGVKITQVESRQLQEPVKTVAYVNHDQDSLIHIHPRVSGWIEKLYVKSLGATVEKGQALYDIYSPELVNAQEELLLALERDNPRLINAAHNRLTSLQLSEKTISAIKSTKVIKQHITFYAPQQGVIENLPIREGYFVEPGATLMSISDLSKVWLDVEVFAHQASMVSVNDKVEVTLDYLPQEHFIGKVDFIYPTLNSYTRTVTARVGLDNNKGLLKPNMYVNAKIYPSDHSYYLMVPRQAVIRTENQNRIVLALGEGKFKSIEVILGRVDGEFVEVLSGLTVGEEIVNSAQFLLDSESSKSSDFLRIDSPEREETKVSRATTTGIINSIMKNMRHANISRAAIDKWNRPAATVDFLFTESLDISELVVGQKVEFSFEVNPQGFMIFEIKPLKEQALEQVAL